MVSLTATQGVELFFSPLQQPPTLLLPPRTAPRVYLWTSCSESGTNPPTAERGDPMLQTTFKHHCRSLVLCPELQHCLSHFLPKAQLEMLLAVTTIP